MPVRHVLAFGILGCTFVIAQVLLLRESVLLARGNELSIGIVLGNWMLAAGLGSAMAGKSAARLGRSREAYVLLQAAVSVLVPVSVLAARTSRHWLGLPPWEPMGFGRVAWVTLLVVGPAAFASGAMFTIGCRMQEEADPGSDRAPATVYALESAGAVLGSAALSFLLLGRLKPLQIALVVGVIHLASALSLVCTGLGRARAGLAAGTALSKAEGALAVCLLVLALSMLLSPGARLLEDLAWRLRWKPLKPLESVDSVYGNVNAISLGAQVVVYENGMPTLTTPFPNVADLEESVHIPLLAHPEPKEVLFLGGGVGGALSEALKHPLAALTYAEIDPALVRTAERHGGPLVRGELEERRVRTVYEDGRSFLLGSAHRYDLIFLRVPEASTVQTNRYFTREFFERARERLNEGGIFSFSMPGSEAHLSEDLARLNRCAKETLREAFPQVRILPGERNLFLASTWGGLSSVTAEDLERERTDRAINTRWLGSDSIRYRMDSDRHAWLEEELKRARSVASNRDLKPVLVRYFLWHHFAETSAYPGTWISVAKHLGPAGAVAAWAGIGLLPFLRLLFCRAGARRFALSYVVFTTGAVAMALEMTALLLFQALYGYVYQWLGVLIAAFMAGLAGGSLAAARWIEKSVAVFRGVFLLEGFLFSFVLGLAAGLSGLPGLPVQAGGPAGAFKPVLVGLMIVAGFLAGAEYPMAVKGAGSTGRTGRQAAEAGRLYGLDLAGALVGTLFMGVVLVPWIGIPGTLIACALWKAAGFCCVGLARADRRGRKGGDEG